jgi:membrane protein implicated in regulation of membrane protease activity
VPLQAAVFAVLTIVTTLAGRRFLPLQANPGGDINDTLTRLTGSEGVVAQSFQAGLGRVLVDGKEWAAELDGGGTLASGAKVIVTDVGGARLRVKAY